MIGSVRHWAGLERNRRHNRRLGTLLAAIAGAANAGGFLAVGIYTSHMTGVASSAADAWVLGDPVNALFLLSMLLAFMAGAMCTAIQVNWGLQRHWHSAYCLPLLLEAWLLLFFGLFGQATLPDDWLNPATIWALCFMMGLQNAVISKISRAEIRTTHITGLVTDLGIELGRLAYHHSPFERGAVPFNPFKVRLQVQLIASFIGGGVAGAYGFLHLGFHCATILALLLLGVVAHPLWLDLRRLLK